LTTFRRLRNLFFQFRLQIFRHRVGIFSHFFIFIFLYVVYSAAALLAVQSADYPRQFRLSVRLSVCRSHAGTLSRRMKIGSRGLHCKVAKALWFSGTDNSWERRPLPPKICAQSDPPPPKSTDIDQCLLNNVSTVRASEKNSVIANRKSTTRFPTSYR